jgi:hypothetical protein
MKITRTILNEIIREEAALVMAEKKLQQDGPGNPYRSTDGEYTSYEDARSWSHGGKQKEMKSGKDVKPCGRGQRSKCKSPQELKWEGVVSKMMDVLQEEYEETIDEKKKRRKGKQPGPRCLTTAEVTQLRQQVYQQLMAVVSDYEAAKKSKTAS